MVVSLALTMSLRGQEKPKPAPLPEVAVAERVISERDTVGITLINIFGDMRRPGKERDQAALTLGKMRYTAAIPMLIEHITLVKDQEAFSDGPEQTCVESLRMFGDEAVPAIVDAYLTDNTPGQDRRFCLYSSIPPSAIQTARLYAKGRAWENPDEKYQQRVKEFLHDIKPNISKGQKPKGFDSLYELAP